MAVYSPISNEELEKFLLQYDIGSLIESEGILEGIENTNYKLKTSKNKYILTIFEKIVNPKDLPFYINLKKHLSKKKFICPKPIKDKSGNYINLLINKYCVIVSFLEGEKTSIVQNIHCKQVGNMLAVLHNESKDFNGNLVNTMDYNQWKKLFLKCQNKVNNKFKEIMPIIDRELLYLNRVWPKDLPSGIIHADAFQDNVFFKDNKFTGLIDFYFACNDYLAYDISLTINAWCFELNGRFNNDKFFSLLKGYQNSRQLKDIEKINLSILLRGAALRILLTRVHDYLFHQDGAYVKPKDPKEYQLILEFHQQNNLGALL